MRREICVSKLIGLAYSWKEIYGFCFVLLCIWGQFPSTSTRELIFGGAIKRRGFWVTSLGALYLEGLIHGGTYFRNFTVRHKKATTNCWWAVKVFTSFYLAIHTIHYLLEKDLKILEGFPKIDQKAEEMVETRKGDQATRQFETIQVIIIEAELLFSPLQCWF